MLASPASHTSPPGDTVAAGGKHEISPWALHSERRGREVSAWPCPHLLASEGARVSVGVPRSQPLLHLLLSALSQVGLHEPQTPEGQGQNRGVRCCCPQHGSPGVFRARAETPHRDGELRGGSLKHQVRENPPRSSCSDSKPTSSETRPSHRDPGKRPPWPLRSGRSRTRDAAHPAEAD